MLSLSSLSSAASSSSEIAFEVVATIAGWNHFGPVRSGWCAATAGPDPPRLSLPDLQARSLSVAFGGGLPGPVGGPNCLLSFL